MCSVCKNGGWAAQGVEGGQQPPVRGRKRRRRAKRGSSGSSGGGSAGSLKKSATNVATAAGVGTFKGAVKIVQLARVFGNKSLPASTVIAPVASAPSATPSPAMGSTQLGALL